MKSRKYKIYRGTKTSRKSVIKDSITKNMAESDIKDSCAFKIAQKNGKMNIIKTARTIRRRNGAIFKTLAKY